MSCDPVDVFAFASTADKPYEMDWAEWLEGAIITLATVTVGPQILALVDTHDLDFTVGGSTVVKVWVRGLDAGEGSGLITVAITASDGRKDARAWRFDVCEA